MVEHGLDVLADAVLLGDAGAGDELGPDDRRLTVSLGTTVRICIRSVLIHDCPSSGVGRVSGRGRAARGDDALGGSAIVGVRPTEL
jgi:hypothetical protein